MFSARTRSETPTVAFIPTPRSNSFALVVRCRVHEQWDSVRNQVCLPTEGPTMTGLVREVSPSTGAGVTGVGGTGAGVASVAENGIGRRERRQRKIIGTSAKKKEREDKNVRRR